MMIFQNRGAEVDLHLAAEETVDHPVTLQHVVVIDTVHKHRVRAHAHDQLQIQDHVLVHVLVQDLFEDQDQDKHNHDQEAVLALETGQDQLSMLENHQQPVASVFLIFMI